MRERERERARVRERERGIMEGVRVKEVIRLNGWKEQQSVQLQSANVSYFFAIVLLYYIFDHVNLTSLYEL